MDDVRDMRLDDETSVAVNLKAVAVQLDDDATVVSFALVMVRSERHASLVRHAALQPGVTVAVQDDV